ncbi:YdaU family protein [Rhodoplanes sp. Z2-YC6860]|uniref:YdaU family protein n=1 Tax=Rhodoplanes sp. Z2-YC6860 TaxID=674703 RepID=UPI00078DD8B2|nr:DUF1376 domain-containing protein [Rhodoplanes sp. Z2-YC6860]AMN43142.1 hypothetical protein RHPLAN_47160 [Rhodoplanes sp. Z2-YC6860]
MSRRPWFPLFVADYRGGTLDLSLEQHGCYLLLLMTAWQRADNALPNDMRLIRAVLPAMHGHAFNRIVPPLLDRFWTLGDDNCWRNPRLDAERQKTDKRSANARQSAGKRWGHASEINGIADAPAMLPQSQSQEERTGTFGKMKRQREWPTHGAVSKRRGTIWLKSGSSDFDLYAADYRAKNRIDPPLDALGGYWFNICGEAR